MEYDINTLETLDPKLVIAIVKNRDYMEELMLDVSNKPIFNLLVSTYLINETNKRKDKDYKRLLVSKFIEWNKDYIDRIMDIFKCSYGFAIDLSIFIIPLNKDESSLNIGKRIYRFTSKIYSTYQLGNDQEIFKEGITENMIEQFIRLIFGRHKYLDEALYYILIEKRSKTLEFDSNQLNAWNTITNFLIDSLETLSDKRLLNLLIRYKEIMDSGFEPRLNLFENIALADYPSIAKAISKLY